MTGQVVTVGAAAPPEEEASKGAPSGVWLPKVVFRCFCGLSFPDREPFDAHLSSAHPEMIATCGDCGRVLPKGQWRIDDGVFHLEESGTGDEATRA